MEQAYKTSLQSEQTFIEDVQVAKKEKASLLDRVGIVLALFSLYIIWGSTYFGMRLALHDFPPFIMAGVRFLIAGMLLYGFLRLRGTPRPSRAQWIGAAVVGLLLLGGGNGGV